MSLLTRSTVPSHGPVARRAPSRDNAGESNRASRRRGRSGIHDPAETTLDLGIAGRTALLCGASRGIGKAIALRLAREGVNVVLVARRQGPLVETAAEIRKLADVSVATVCADVGTPEGRARALEACPDPDVLLNNADSPLPADFRDCTREDWIAAFDALTLGPIELIRSVLDGMASRGFGRIVNITSRSVRAAQADHPLSNGARSALTGFIAGIARSRASCNVTINNVLPGIFATGAQERHVAELARQTGRAYQDIWNERAAGNPAQRYGEPEEAAVLVAYLCSNQAGFITGQNILIDGGSYPGTL